MIPDNNIQHCSIREHWLVNISLDFLCCPIWSQILLHRKCPQIFPNGCPTYWTFCLRSCTFSAEAKMSAWNQSNASFVFQTYYTTLILIRRSLSSKIKLNLYYYLSMGKHSRRGILVRLLECRRGRILLVWFRYFILLFLVSFWLVISCNVGGMVYIYRFSKRIYSYVPTWR